MRPQIAQRMGRALSVATLLLLSACGDRLAPAPSAPAAPKAAPTAALQPADLVRGQQVYLDKQCVACHGPAAAGGIGPALADTTLPFDRYLNVLRRAVPPKPAFNEAELTTQDAFNLYSWTKSLRKSAAAGTATPAPALPSGQVLGMSLWVKAGCDTCHGAFGQGSVKAPGLAGLNATTLNELGRMRATSGTIAAHAAQNIDDSTFSRLYGWLIKGANPQDGC